jgi:hypothetical protein
LILSLGYRGGYQHPKEFYGGINGGGMRAGERLKVEAVDGPEGLFLKFDVINLFSPFSPGADGCPNGLILSPAY